MGCTQTKSIKSKKNTKNNHETIVTEIIQVVEELDEIKEKYIIKEDVSIELGCFQAISVEEFLLTSYKTNQFSKEQLQLIFQQIKEIFQKIQGILSRINHVLEQKETQQVKPEVEEVYNDFLNIFEKMTHRILSMPAISLENYQPNEVSKCVTGIDSQSIIM